MEFSKYVYHHLSSGSVSSTTTECDIDNEEQQQQQQQQAESARVPLTQLDVVNPAFLRTLITHTFNFALFFLPSFVQNLILSRPEERRIHKTSFLDGLRGVAALLVHIVHQMGDKRYWYAGPYTRGPFLETEDPDSYANPIQLPWIRMIYSLGLMVPTFFVISGYVLSYRAIQFLRAPHEKGVFATGRLTEIMFSSIFRRGFRLFLPSLAGLALNQFWMLLARMPYKSSGPDLRRHLSDYWELVKLLFRAIWHFDGPRISALQQFWTIPIEFGCSMLLFVVIIGTSGLSSGMRMFAVAMLMTVCLYANHCAFLTFFGGMFLADLEEMYVEHAEREKTESQQLNDEESEITSKEEKEHSLEEAGYFMYLTKIRSNRKKINSILHSAFWVIIFIISTYIMGWPTARLEKDTILWWADQRLGGNRTVYTASFAFVACVFRFKWLQKIYTTRIALYLGDISYSMYIVHYALLYWNNKILVVWVNAIFGAERKGMVNRMVANAVEVTAFLPVVIIVADIFWRVVDIPSVKFARWMEQKCRRKS